MAIKIVNQIVDYIRGITPKLVTSLRMIISAFLCPGRHSFIFEEISHRLQAVGNIVFELTGPRFEPQISRTRDECSIIALPTDRYYKNVLLLIILLGHCGKTCF